MSPESEFQFVPTQPPSLRPDILEGYKVLYFGEEIGNIWRTAVGWTHSSALSLREERSKGKPPWKTFRTRHQAVGDLLQAWWLDPAREVTQTSEYD